MQPNQVSSPTPTQYRSLLLMEPNQVFLMQPNQVSNPTPTQFRSWLLMKPNQVFLI